MGADGPPLVVLRRIQILTLFLALLLAGSGGAQTLAASANGAPTPNELAPAIKSQLTPTAVTVQSGSATLEFWWVKALDRGDSAAEGWAGVAEGALVGAVRVSEPYPDIRGRRIKPGVYTLRFALQPMNGDHLGVSPHREFLLVSPAAVDTNPAPVGYQGAVDLSKQTTGASHPAVWSIDPPSASGPPLAAVSNSDGLQSVVFTVHDLTFGLVLIGKIEA